MRESSIQSGFPVGLNCSGIEYAKPRGNRAYIGHKPSFTREQFVRVRVMLGQETLSTHRERNGAGATDSLTGSCGS